MLERTIRALLHDRPGALNRVVSILRQRNLNIETLSVIQTLEAGVSEVTIVVDSPVCAVTTAKLRRLIDVFDVNTLETWQKMQAREYSVLLSGLLGSVDSPDSVPGSTQADGGHR